MVKETNLSYPSSVYDRIGLNRVATVSAVSGLRPKWLSTDLDIPTTCFAFGQKKRKEEAPFPGTLAASSRQANRTSEVD